jgi:hypothetical protein
MKILSNETELTGKWIFEHGRVRGDATCERIQWLTSHYLKKLGISEESGGWEALFQDPEDQRLWEQTYPESGMQGGGPPALRCISKEVARKKYQTKQF